MLILKCNHPFFVQIVHLIFNSETCLVFINRKNYIINLRKRLEAFRPNKTIGHLQILMFLVFSSKLFKLFTTLWFFIYVFAFYYVRLNNFRWRDCQEKNNLWFFYVACVKFCEWAKNGKMLLLHLCSFYLLETFASKESISIIILIFFHVDLNFLHSSLVKVTPLKVIPMWKLSISGNLYLIFPKLHDFTKVIEII